MLPDGSDVSVFCELTRVEALREKERRRRRQRQQREILSFFSFLFLSSLVIEMKLANEDLPSVLLLQVGTKSSYVQRDFLLLPPDETWSINNQFTSKETFSICKILQR